MKTYLYVIIILSILIIPLKSDIKNKKKLPSLNKPTETSDIWLDANRLSGVFRNNGIWHFDVVENMQGTFWPAASGKSPVFAAGEIIAAKVNAQYKVAAVKHSATEFQAGEIGSPGVALNPKDPKYRWYELRSDGRGDWNNWPTEQGAPLDENGVPLLIGDQTIFSVWNDLADHAEFGTNKLSVEVRQTAFAFDNYNALGDVQFIKWQLVNKSGQFWDSTYFAIWMDPDLGDARDDLVGCDTILGMGFCYNASNVDQTYGFAPPAVGVDFIQGPIIEQIGSTVQLPDGTVVQDKKMLQMTCFVYYDSNDSNSGNPSDGSDIWGYMRGFWRDGTPITYGDRGSHPPDPLHPPTSFMFSGDPEHEQVAGWLDYAEDDRNFHMSTGSFPMAAWTAFDLSSDLNGNGQPDFGEPGVQEIVAAVMVARGFSNLNSVTVLKEVDQLAELAYSHNFKFVTSPESPVVQVSELSNEVILSWDDRSEYNKDGNLYDAEDPFLSFYIGDTIYVNNFPVIIDDSTYNFYGYTVYQYSSIEGDNPVVYDTWNIGEGKDPRPYTETRYIKITENKNPEVGTKGTPLVNGKEYYYSVKAESFNEFGNPKFLQNEPDIFSVTPRVTPGITGFSSLVGDTIVTEHLRIDPNIEFGTGEIYVIVVDPSKTTGNDYRVSFISDTIGSPLWYLLNMTTGDTVLKDQKNQRGDDAYTIVDGLLVKVISDIYNFTSFQCVANANGPINPPESAAAPWQNFPCPTGVDPDGYVTAGQQVGTGHWMFHTGDTAPGGFRGSYEAFLERSMRSNNMQRAVPYDWEMRFTSEGSWAVRAFEDGRVLKVPFELWCVGIRTLNNPSDDFRLIPWFLSSGGVGGLQTDTTGMTWQLDPNDHSVSGGSNDPYTPWIYWMIPDEHEDYSAGQVGYQAFLAAIDTVAGNEGSYGYGGEEVIARSVFVNWNGDDVSDGIVDPATQMIPEQGTVFRFITTNPNNSNDYFKFTAPAAAVVISSSLKEDMKRIKVVPNPYYGLHSGELNGEDRWVQFTYLPPQCTIRIFTLAGHLCRKLEKNDPLTPFLKWDMRNEHNLPLGSGVYIYHVDAPGIGEKIGKIVIYSPDYK